MQDILGFIGSIGDILGNFIDLIKNLFITLGSMFATGVGFITAIITTIPNVLINDVFANLPGVFKYGLTGLFCVFIFIFALKLFQAIKFW